MLLTILVLAPALIAAVLASARRLPWSVARVVWLATSLAEVAVFAVLWALYARGAGSGGGNPIAFEARWAWIPGARSGWHVGIDGLSLPLLLLTAVVFAASAVYSWREPDRPRQFAALFLALETTCLGLFVALDLIVFFLFFDLSIVGMYFVIAIWGHGATRTASALKFFLYTFLGSLALLLGFIGLYLAADPHTFDMIALTRQAPLHGHGATGVLVLLAITIGLAVKTPTFPFHTWLPPAHTDAPAAGSAVLAGVMLKMGTYGFVRIAMPMLPHAWRQLAWLFVVVGVVSVLWGALVALAQTSFKRMIAYTSVNHMGYIVLAVGAAGLLGGTDAQARSLAVTGAIVQMVSHGLITAALFLLAGTLFDRGGTYDLDRYGGLASSMPRFATLTAVAAFASLGIPGFSGFLAEFQILAGSLPSATIPTAIAALGIIITAGLFLWALQRLLLGAPATTLASTTTADGGRTTDTAGGGSEDPADGDAGDIAYHRRPFADLRMREWLPTGALLLGAFVIGVYPRLILAIIEPSSRAIAHLVTQ